MPGTTQLGRIPWCTASAALSVALLTTGACGIGARTGPHHHGDVHGPSYVVDTAPTTAPVELVRIHGHRGHPGVGDRDVAGR
jgi:hypothetical protein